MRYTFYHKISKLRTCFNCLRAERREPELDTKLLTKCANLRVQYMSSVKNMRMSTRISQLMHIFINRWRTVVRTIAVGALDDPAEKKQKKDKECEKKTVIILQWRAKWCVLLTAMRANEFTRLQQHPLNYHSSVLHSLFHFHFYFYFYL